MFEKYPMVGILAVVVIAVFFRTQWGALVTWGLGIYLAICTLLVARAPSAMRPRFGLMALTSALALCFSFHHGNALNQSERTMARWKESRDSWSKLLGGRQWHPIVMRGTIDQPVRLRRAYLTFGNSPTERDKPQTSISQLGWQSLTILQVQEIRSDAVWRPSSMTVTLTIDERTRDLLPGDNVEIHAQWRLPPPATNPGQWDMANRYAEMGYAAQAKVESIEHVSRWKPAARFRLDRTMAIVSAIAIESMERNIPFGQSTLACALILGQRDMAAWRLQEDLLATGTIHMLSISGMHIEMIAAALLVFGSSLAIRKEWLLGGVCVIIWSYSVLCGANPPVLRAAIMLSAAFLARCMGWQYSSLNNLAIAGVILVIARSSVVFEIGTQLSFMAVAVLIVSGERLLKRPSPLQSLMASRSSMWRKSFRAGLGWCVENVRTSFWVWFLTAPLVWTGFHVVSPIAIVLNLILWIPMLISLVAGLGMILFGWLPWIGPVLGFLCGFQLWIVDEVVKVAERIPWGHFWLVSPPMVWLYLFYAIGLSIAALFGTRLRSARRRLLFALLAWFVLGLTIDPAVRAYRHSGLSEKQMTITFLDVGHGSHVWIETPDGQLWCYDAGRMGDHERSYRGMVDALWAMKHSVIDSLILSHADSDHFNAMEGILERFTIKRFLTSPQVLDHTDSMLLRLRGNLAERQVKEFAWLRGMSEEYPDWNVLVLHPPAKDVGRNDNANSLCLLFEYAGRRVLLPGDLEPPGTSYLLSHPSTPIDVLMAPHHGSIHSQVEKVLDWCKPSHVVISSSQRSLSPKLEASLEPDKRNVMITGRDAAIRISIHEDSSIELLHWRDGSWQTFTKSPDK